MPRPLAVPDGGFRSIAVLRLSSLGDVVLALPVVQALRAAYPAARLHIWVKEEFAGAVRHEAAIDHVRVLERDARRLEDLVSMSAELEDCDLIVDLHGNARTRLLTFRQRAPVLRARSFRLRRALHVHGRALRPAALPRALDRYATALARLGLAAPGPPALSTGPEADAWARAFAIPGGPPVVAFCPGAAHPTKRWPEDRWAELSARLGRDGVARLVFATPPDRRAMPAFAAAIAADAGARWIEEPIERVAALLSRCAVAVTHDSGLMHVAAARGRPVVAMFGSTSPALGFAPAGEGHAVLCRNEPCQPCTLHGRVSCPKGHFRCMTGLGVDEVLDTVRERLARA
jgi:ADP-heptose:LPS heptosyltransferase